MRRARHCRVPLLWRLLGPWWPPPALPSSRVQLRLHLSFEALPHETSRVQNGLRCLPCPLPQLPCHSCCFAIACRRGHIGDSGPSVTLLPRTRIRLVRLTKPLCGSPLFMTRTMPPL